MQDMRQAIYHLAIIALHHRKERMSTETKPTNPKDIVGSKKLPLSLVPETAVAEMATAFLEGALKYGRFNWRIDGVRASIYYDAMKRHQAKWFNGENRDKETRVRHLASVMACCAIIMDAELCGKLVDDRPPSAPMAKFIDGMAGHVRYLQELFREHTPKQFTIADAEPDQDLDIADFIRANGSQAFYSKPAEMHHCQEGCPNIPKAAGETS